MSLLVLQCIELREEIAIEVHFCQKSIFFCHLLLYCLHTGAALLAHPGENATGDIILVSAPRCTLLKAAEELGLCKMYADGNMEAFSYDDKDNFKNSGK